MFSDLFKAAVSVVTTPVALVADVVTLGGTLTDRNETYTGKAISDLVQNLENATDPNK